MNKFIYASYNWVFCGEYYRKRDLNVMLHVSCI